MTKNNELLLNIIESHRIHPTAEDILEIARESSPKISLGTVYRNLNFLADSGKIRRISIPNEPDHFDCIIPHDHLKCTKCGKIVDIDKIECKAGNLPEGVMVEYYTATAYGLCSECSCCNTEA